MAEQTGSSADYDVIVIGAGAVGENVADRTVQRGLRTVIVESELVGGECSYWACMPSKALLRSGAAVTAAQRVGGAAEAVMGELDVAAVLRRRDSVTSTWSDEGQVSWLEKTGIALVRGTEAPTTTAAAPTTDETATSVATARGPETRTSASGRDELGHTSVAARRARGDLSSRDVPA